MLVNHIRNWNDYLKFEYKINEFLREMEIEDAGPTFKLLDIKYSCSVLSINEILYSALIIFELIEKNP